MTPANRKIAVAIKIALLAAPGVQLAYAADEKPALEEVVVYGEADTYRPDDQTTATGLRLKLIDTPQSISVVSAEMLQIFNVQSAYDAVDLIPGASQDGYGFGLQQLSLRGQRLSQGRINGINARSEQFVDSFALDRLEIVRGPATVLYGVSGAFGGELNQILKKPQAGLHGNFGVEGGDFDNRRIEGDITGSIPGTDDRLKARLVGSYGESQNFQDTVVDADNVARLISGAVTYDFTENTTASFYAYKESKDFDPQDGCPLAVDSNNRLYIPRAIQPEHLYCNDPNQSEAEFDTDFLSASLAHTFGNDFRLNATFARATFERTTEYTYGFGPAGHFGLADTDVYLYSYKDLEEGETLTGNLSLDGSFELGNRTHQFLVALEYQKQEQDRPIFASFGLGVINMFRDGGKGILNDGTPVPDVPDYGPPVDDRGTDIKSYRGSVQFLFNPMDRLQLLIGGLVENIDQTVVRSVNNGVSSTLEDTNTVGRFGITYGLVKEAGDYLTDAKAYFSYSEGFKPNVGVFGEGGVPLTDPQEMTAYEIGLKTQWMNGNVDASIAAYKSTVSNVPTSYFAQAGAGFVSVLQGDQHFDGIELEVLGEVLPGWNLGVSYAYTDNELNQLLFPNTLKVANIPEQQVSVHTSYEFLRGALEGLTIGAAFINKQDVPLVDAALTMYNNGWDPANQVPWSGSRFDFQASYQVFEGALKGTEISLNVYNAFDDRSFFSTDVPGTPSFGNTVGPPRTITVGVRFRF